MNLQVLAQLAYIENGKCPDDLNSKEQPRKQHEINDTLRFLRFLQSQSVSLSSNQSHRQITGYSMSQMLNQEEIMAKRKRGGHRFK